jgi:4-hydroxy-L-threonine phosphate dehydrogenase PdxA
MLRLAVAPRTNYASEATPLAVARSGTAQGGEAAYHYLDLAARLAVEGRGAAICTGPLNKETRNSAGHKFPGHTDP